MKVKISPAARDAEMEIAGVKIPRWYSTHVGDVFEVQRNVCIQGCLYRGFFVVSGDYNGQFIPEDHARVLDGEADWAAGKLGSGH